MNKNTYFTVNRNVYFKCYFSDRGNTEKAELYIKYKLVSIGKYSWSNRPWQRFTYDIAIREAYSNATLSKHYSRLINQFIENGGRREAKRIKKELGTIATIASLGSFFSKDKKESNDWKSRMLKAGLNLDMPSDWDDLTEAEKEKRLDKVIGFMQSKEG